MVLNVSSWYSIIKWTKIPSMRCRYQLILDLMIIPAVNWPEQLTCLVPRLRWAELYFSFPFMSSLRRQGKLYLACTWFYDDVVQFALFLFIYLCLYVRLNLGWMRWGTSIGNCLRFCVIWASAKPWTRFSSTRRLSMFLLPPPSHPSSTHNDPTRPQYRSIHRVPSLAVW
jgi:hypothetical protein